MVTGIAVYIVISIAVSLSMITSDIPTYFGCPKYIYDHSKLNVFGVIGSSIILFCLIPLYYILWFLYWIGHVGRK